MIEWLPNYENENTTNESTYKKEIVSEINNTKERPESIFPIDLGLIYQYKRKNPSQMVKYEKYT